MKTRFFVTLFAVLAVVAAACGSGGETAAEVVDAGEGVAEPIVEDPAEPVTTTTAAPDTSTEAPSETEAQEGTTTAAPPDTEPPADQTTTPAPAEETEEPVGEEIPAAAVDGQALYESNCTRCHSDDGSGGRGNNLQGIAVEQPETTAGIEIVTNGKGSMPEFGDDLTPEEIEAVVNYVWETF